MPPDSMFFKVRSHHYRRLIFRAVTAMTWVLLCPLSSLLAGNFLCDDPQIEAAAEQARLRSALFWSGAPLPGEWSTPCPIAATAANHSGSGKTQFRLEQGEVFGWRMEIAGTRDGLLRNVIPHEVDHMVRASLVRRGVERWLDEGCALLMESPEIHAEIRRSAMRIDPETINIAWLEETRYPTSAREVDELYSLGFSVVEFLLTRGSPSRLLEFQRDPSSMEVRLQRHYTLSVQTLRSNWQKWRETKCPLSCTAGACAGHPLPQSKLNTIQGQVRPLLTIWTATWCGPCQRLKQDLAANIDFRKALESAYELQWKDFDAWPQEARTAGVIKLPTFILPDRRWTGYSGLVGLQSQLPMMSPGESPATPLTEKPAQAIPEKSAVPPAELLAEPATPVAQTPVAQTPVVQAPVPTTEQQTTGQKTTEQKTTEQKTDAARKIQAGPKKDHPRILPWLPLTLTALQWAGLIGGSVVTGGVGGVALSALTLLIRLRTAAPARNTSSSSESSSHAEGGSGGAVQAPFPRQLDEAGQLLELRQSEGRVATLDTLRGMFLDDELDKLAQTDTPSAQLAAALRTAIDSRVEEVAPLTTQY